MECTISQETPVKPLNKHWEFGIGSGHAALALRADYVKQLKFIHDELGIKYVRFHGIFNDDMHTFDDFSNVLDLMENGYKYKELNFYLCGVVYDNILSCGMKPFVELSFMPQSLAKEKTTNKTFYGTNFHGPRDLDEWGNYIKSFVSYLLHRYGNKEVESWFFEVWNEPDLKDAFFIGTQADYFELYEVTARAIKEVNPNLQVGGPSTSGSKWVKEFVEFCEGNSVPIDFASTHQYAGDPFTGVEDKGGPQSQSSIEPDTGDKTEDKAEKVKKMLGKLEAHLPADATPLQIIRMMFGDPSESKELSNASFKNNSKTVQQQANGLPVYYTEWNMLATFSAYSNDTKKAAAYNVKTALDIENYVTGSSVWCFSDIFEEMHQFKEEFHGGFGLQTIHGIPKPSFYGFKMLSLLSDDRYDLGDNATDGEIGVAAFKGEQNKREILLFRQKMKQSDLTGEQAVIKIQLEQEPEKVTLRRIDDQHCNPLNIWEEEGSKADLTPAEVNGIISRSQMIAEDLTYEFSDGWLTVDTNLAVNDVQLIEIY